MAEGVGGSGGGSSGPSGSPSTSGPDAAAMAEMLAAGGGPAPAGKVAEKTPEGRIKFVHGGRTIYEWEQSLEEVNIYITPPAGVKAKMIDCTVKPRHLSVGLKGNPPFLNEALAGLAVVDESYWMMEDGVLHINIQKAHKAETWPSAIAGHGELDPMTKTEAQKKMMLERFQEENPGFDFSGADFSGTVPDPRTFMEGVKYQ